MFVAAAVYRLHKPDDDTERMNKDSFKKAGESKRMTNKDQVVEISS